MPSEIEDGITVQYDSGSRASYPGQDIGPSGHKRVLDRLDFAAALAALKTNQRVTRAGWLSGSWLVLVRPWTGLPGTPPEPLWHLYPQSHSALRKATSLPWIGIQTPDESFVPWSASQVDILAEDWEVL